MRWVKRLPLVDDEVVRVEDGLSTVRAARREIDATVAAAKVRGRRPRLSAVFALAVAALSSLGLRRLLRGDW